MKVRKDPRDVILIECDHQEASLLVTALHNHTADNRRSAQATGLPTRVADQLKRDADACEALAGKLEHVC